MPLESYKRGLIYQESLIDSNRSRLLRLKFQYHVLSFHENNDITRMADTEHEMRALGNSGDLHTRNSLKPPSENVWQNKNGKPGQDNCGGRKRSEQWSRIQCPKFVDFNNLPETGDSFFDRVTVIVSTPKSDFDHGNLPNSFEEEDTLIAPVNHVSLSRVEHDPPKEAPCILNNGNEKSEEDYVVHDARCTRFQEKRGAKGNCAKVKKPQTTTVKPFTFDLRQKQGQEHKQERINRIREEEKKMKVFRANPVPKCLKVRSVPHNTNKHKSNENRTKDRNDKIESNANEKGQRTNSSENPIKKNTEVWKKPPFVPSFTKKSSVPPKTPPLHSALRAKERKLFDNIIKEREMQREQARQMELLAKKKKEKEEVARLRKQTVHKAQPVPKYKMCAPRAEKRPLTDHISPKSLKRRCM